MIFESFFGIMKEMGIGEKNNKKDYYDEYANSCFFTVMREGSGIDTREQVCDIIAKYFGLME